MSSASSSAASSASSSASASSDASYASMKSSWMRASGSHVATSGGKPSQRMRYEVNAFSLRFLPCHSAIHPWDGQFGRGGGMSEVAPRAVGQRCALTLPTLKYSTFRSSMRSISNVLLAGQM